MVGLVIKYDRAVTDHGVEEGSEARDWAGPQAVNRPEAQLFVPIWYIMKIRAES